MPRMNSSQPEMVQPKSANLEMYFRAYKKDIIIAPVCSTLRCEIKDILQLFAMVGKTQGGMSMQLANETIISLEVVPLKFGVGARADQFLVIFFAFFI